MCGRYASFLPAEALRAMFDTVNATPNWEPTWNMAPTRDAPVVRLHPETRARHLDLLRWGLVPHWAKDLKSVRQPINARSETLATSAMFRDALEGFLVDRGRFVLRPGDVDQAGLLGVRVAQLATAPLLVGDGGTIVVGVGRRAGRTEHGE